MTKKIGDYTCYDDHLFLSSWAIRRRGDLFNGGDAIICCCLNHRRGDMLADGGDSLLG